MNSETFIVGLVTAVLTYLGTKAQGQYLYKSEVVKSQEGSKDSVYNGWKDLFDTVKKENEALKESMAKLQLEFHDFKRDFYLMKKEFNEKETGYQIQIEKLTEENEELKEENAELKLEVSYLKEEKNGNSIK